VYGDKRNFVIHLNSALKSAGTRRYSDVVSMMMFFTVLTS